MIHHDLRTRQVNWCATLKNDAFLFLVLIQQPIILLNLSQQHMEYFWDILSSLRRALKEGHTPRGGKTLGLLSGHLSFIGKVFLAPNQDAGYIRCVAKGIKQCLIDFNNVFEGWAGGDGEDEGITVYADTGVAR